MKKLGATGQRWLKGFHSLFACMWVGAGICLSVPQFVFHPTDGGELHGVTALMEFIDFWIIVPGAIGVLVTGLLYSMFTNWGWFKHNWITTKWIICAFGVVFGTYPLGPWMTGLARIAKERGPAALQDPSFLHNQQMLQVFGTFQAATLVFAVFVTALKPWNKKSATAVSGARKDAA